MGEAKAEMTALQKHGEGAFAQLGAAGKVAAFALGATVVTIGAASVKLASDFDAAMEQIRTQAHAPQSEVDTLKSKVLDLAGPVATAPQVLADALYHIESVGLRGANAMDILKIAAEGAKVGHANLTDVTNALDAAIVSNIKGVENHAQAMGRLNAIVGVGDMKMQDLADAMGGGVLAVVKNYGLSLNDVGAALAVFGDSNIRGADAGTKLRMAVQAMAVPVKGGAAELKNLGMTSDQMAKDMESGGLIKALQDLHQHMDAAGIKGDQVGEVLTTVFGKKAGSGVAVLYDQFSRLQDKYGQIDQGATKFGDDWAATQQTFQFKTQALIASLEALGVRLGEWLIPIVEKVATVISGVIGWFEKHRTAAIALGAVIGGVVVTALVAAATAFIAANGAILLLVAAVGAVVAGLIVAWPTIQRWSADVVKAWNTVFAEGSRIWNAIWQVISQVLSAVAGFVTKEVGFVEQWWHDHMQAISDVAKVVWTVIKDYIAINLAIIRDVIIGVINVIRAVWQNVWNVIKDVAVIAWTGIKTTVDIAIHVVLDTIGIVLDLITGKWGKAWRDIKDLLSTVWNDMVALLGTFVSRFFDAGKNIIGGLVNGITAMVGNTLNTIGDLGGKIIDKIKGIFGISSPSSVFYDIGLNLIKGLEGGIAKGLTNLVTSGLQDLIGKIGGALGISGGGGGILGLFGGIGGAIRGLFGGGGGGSSGSAPANASGIAGMMQQMAAVRGWSGGEWTALYQVEQREAGFNLNARNPSSGAYGLAQFINGPGEYAQYGGNLSAAGQITAMLNYISQRYGTPSNAWQHELQFGWYDQGGILKPGITLAANLTGQNEYISRTPPGGGGSGPVTIVLQLNGHELAKAIFPDLQTVGLRRGRQTVNLGLS